MKSLVKVLLTVSFLALFLGAMGNIIASVEITELKKETNKQDQQGSVVEQLFESEPRNPTQILKAKVSEDMKGLPLEEMRVETRSNVKPESELEVGDIVVFRTIIDFSSSPYLYANMEARLLAIGEHCYIFIEEARVLQDGSTTTTLKAEKWQNEFDNQIYPANVQYFGHPDGYLGDIDGDPKVTVLLRNIGYGIAGYFNPIHEFSETIYSDSNEREMVFIEYSLSDNYGFGVLAHEFQHLIHFNHDMDELWFIDEGCAELAVYINGYLDNSNLTYFADVFFRNNPQDSLLYWNYNSAGGKDVRIDYGGAYLFLFYLAEKYGDSFIRDIVDTLNQGAEGIESALSKNGYDLTFNQLYLNWVTALTIDNTEIAEGLYGFYNLEFTVTSSSHTVDTTFPVFRKAIEHVYYGFHIARITNTPDIFIYEINKPSMYTIGLSVLVEDSTGWSVFQQLKDSTNLIFPINGSSITTVYIISSIMSLNTPYVSPNNQFGLGFKTNLDYSLIEAELVDVIEGNYSYNNTSWNLSVSDIEVFFLNGTEITTNNLGDIALILYDEFNVPTEVFPLSYSTENNWHGSFNLQFLKEKTYTLVVSPYESILYGAKTLGSVTIEHFLVVNQPTLELNHNELSITVAFTYSLINYIEIIDDFVVTATLYSSDGEVQSHYSLDYNSSTNLWFTVDNISDLAPAEYYSIVNVRIAGKTITSPASETITINEETSDLHYSMFGLIALFLSTLIVPSLRKRRKT